MLVFIQSRERAKELFQELIYDGLNVDIIHSERTQAQRDNVVKCFRSGTVSQSPHGLVLAGRGSQSPSWSGNGRHSELTVHSCMSRL